MVNLFLNTCSGVNAMIWCMGINVSAVRSSQFYYLVWLICVGLNDWSFDKKSCTYWRELYRSSKLKKKLRKLCLSEKKDLHHSHNVILIKLKYRWLNWLNWGMIWSNIRTLIWLHQTLNVFLHSKKFKLEIFKGKWKRLAAEKIFLVATPKDLNKNGISLKQKRWTKHTDVKKENKSHDCMFFPITRSVENNWNLSRQKLIFQPKSPVPRERHLINYWLQWTNTT